MRNEHDICKTLHIQRKFQSCVNHCCFSQTLPTPFINSPFTSLLRYLIWMCHMFPVCTPMHSVNDIFLNLENASPLIQFST